MTATSMIENILGPSVEPVPIPGPVPPPSPRLAPDEGLTPEENDIGQRARDESAEIAHKVAQGIPGGPAPPPSTNVTVDTGVVVPPAPAPAPTPDADQEDASFGQQARAESAAEARRAAQGFAKQSSITIPTQSSASSVSMPKPKCLKVQGTVDEHFNENTSHGDP